MDTTKEPTRRTLECELTSFLLLVAGLLFLLEAVTQYGDFFVTSHGETAVAVTLVIGSVVIGILYLALSYSCWRDPRNEDSFELAAILAGLLSFLYFVIEIFEALNPHLYSALYLEYVEFVVGYGSVTIFVELLIVFFSWRVYRSLS